MKRFDDAAGYDDDIANVLPGHELVRQAAVSELRAVARAGHRLGVVGPGAGHELVSLCRALNGVDVVAMEPSPAMADACDAMLAESGLAERVRVQRSPLSPTNVPTWDLGLSLFVAHLIDAVGGKRQQYWRALGCHLKPSGVLLHAEICRLSDSELDAWSAFSALQGCSEERVATLRERLTTGFSLLPWQTTLDMANQSGIELDQPIFKIWGVRFARFVRQP